MDEYQVDLRPDCEDETGKMAKGEYVFVATRPSVVRVLDLEW